MSANGITIVGASAGSGKTYRLTQEVTTAIGIAAGESRVALEGLVAVTFTRKAHAELAGRIRHKLVEEGSYDDAMRLPLAYLGTVHAACLRLLQEFALDAGLSPNVDVAGDDPSKLLREALESALEPGLRQRLESLARVTELRLDAKVRRVDWHTPVFDIMDLARSNQVEPDRLPAMAERSVAGLLRLLPEAAADGGALDAELERQLDLARGNLERFKAGKVSPDKHIALIEETKRQLTDDELPWSAWAKLSKLTLPKAFGDAVDGLREAAARYEEHPRLHEHIRDLTHAIFEAARIGLSAYADWKERRRVVDYVDMLDRAHRLLDDPRVRSELERRLQLVVVDEFQDTSPIQLALFVRLHGLSKRSVWVGDRKQCIFEYAGADPLLMDSVAGWVAASGGTRDRLGGNYRSRTELVTACSDLFSAALARHGFTRSEVEVTAQRDVHAGVETRAALDTLPPFGVWCLEAKNAADDAEAIAEGVRRLLAAPDATPIVDRSTKGARPLRPGDVAVLVATNAMARNVAASLHARGMRAALARAGLLGTPEGCLADAALRWLHDQGDTLAAATIDTLTGYEGRTPDVWLEQQIESLRASARPDPAQYTGWRRALFALRYRIQVLSPVEALDAVLEGIDAVALCARWPDAPQRVANLDALRALAMGYENHCAEQREAGTVAGLLRYFDFVREEKLRRDEMLASDDQHVPTDDGAVVVCTYHKSKGLEWPVVVLANLDRKEKRHAFEVSPESDGAAFDPAKPLDGRWIRYWPWPFGQQDKVPLDEAAEQSEEGMRIAAREDKERARLLYVGFTRARDHLVLAVRTRVTKEKGAVVDKSWLDALVNAEGDELLTLPTGSADGAIAETLIRREDGTRLAVATRVARLRPELVELGTSTPARTEVHWYACTPAGNVDRPPYRIRPSADDLRWRQVEEQAAKAQVGRVERLPSAIVLDATKYDYDALGNAVHAFLAADMPGLKPEERTERARRLLASGGMAGVVRPEALVRASDQFGAWVESRWPTAIWQREVRVGAVFETTEGERRVDGSIDLLLETPETYVVVDHKTFPGSTESAVRAKGSAFAGQLAAYAAVLARVDSTKRIETYIHFPIGGMIAEFVLRSVGTTQR